MHLAVILWGVCQREVQLGLVFRFHIAVQFNLNFVPFEMRIERGQAWIAVSASRKYSVSSSSPVAV